MSEDKMREEFNPYVLFGYSFGTREAIAAAKGFDEGVKSCAAIKDAEIAELLQTDIERGDLITELYKEIASRDLMIKKLRREVEDYMHAISVLFAPQAEGDCLAERRPSKCIRSYNAFMYLNDQGKLLQEALAKTEHHDSRALREHEAKVIAEYKQRAEAAEAKLRELDMQENVPEEAYCAAGVEPCACAVANNLDAARYRALRNQDIESDFPRSGVFIGRIPDNKCLTGIDADHAVDALFTAPKQEEK